MIGFEFEIATTRKIKGIYKMPILGIMRGPKHMKGVEALENPHNGFMCGAFRRINGSKDSDRACLLP
jgi:hypothetical protein